MMTNGNTNGNSRLPLQADALDAYNVFCTARTVCFWLMLLGLLIIGACFWVVDVGTTDSAIEALQPDVPAGIPRCTTEPKAIFLAAEATEDADHPEAAPPTLRDLREPVPLPPDDYADQLPEAETSNRAKVIHQMVKIALSCWYFLLPFLAVLYCLSLLIGLKLSLVGRLGGLADSAKAFFLSLIVMVLIVPWQQVCGDNLQIFGTLFTPDQLTSQYWNLQQQLQESTLAQSMGYYTRFVGLWALSLILLITCQWRSRQAARMVRRDESHTTPDLPTSTEPESEC